jgi:hypothetical protein
MEGSKDNGGKYRCFWWVALIALVRRAARAGHVFHLDLFGVKFSRCGCHSIEGLIERQECGIFSFDCSMQLCDIVWRRGGLEFDCG